MRPTLCFNFRRGLSGGILSLPTFWPSDSVKKTLQPATTIPCGELLSVGTANSSNPFVTLLVTSVTVGVSWEFTGVREENTGACGTKRDVIVATSANSSVDRKS